MEKINTDYKQRTWKIQAERFKMSKPWRSSFNRQWAREFSQRRC